mmetsp:Transcript_38226/g.114201  ORF Transcript_38226/g.114201 Transcript_38226/m.114201 type:complete len:130 (+) Transcript_38226:145-534(+)
MPPPPITCGPRSSSGPGRHLELALRTPAHRRTPRGLQPPGAPRHLSFFSLSSSAPPGIERGRQRQQKALYTAQAMLAEWTTTPTRNSACQACDIGDDLIRVHEPKPKYTPAAVRNARPPRAGNRPATAL